MVTTVILRQGDCSEQGLAVASKGFHISAFVYYETIDCEGVHKVKHSALGAASDGQSRSVPVSPGLRWSVPVSPGLR